MSSPSLRRESEGEKTWTIVYLQLNSILIGFSITQLTGAYALIQDFQNQNLISQLISNFVYSSLYIGSTVGVLVAYCLHKFLNPARIIFHANLVTITLVPLSFLSISFAMMVASRTVYGLVSGIYYYIIPVSMEILYPENRTRRALYAGCFENFGIGLGILVGGVVKNYGELGWYLGIIIPVIFATFSMMMSIFLHGKRNKTYWALQQKPDRPNKSTTGKSSKTSVDNLEPPKQPLFSMFYTSFITQTTGYLFLLNYCAQIFNQSLGSLDEGYNFEIFFGIASLLSLPFIPPMIATFKINIRRYLIFFHYGAVLLSLSLADFLLDKGFLLPLGIIISMLIFYLTMGVSKWYTLSYRPTLESRAISGAYNHIVAFLIVYLLGCIQDKNSNRMIAIIFGIVSVIVGAMDIVLKAKLIKPKLQNHRRQESEAVNFRLSPDSPYPSLSREKSGESNSPLVVVSGENTPKFNKKKSSLDSVPIESSPNLIYSFKEVATSTDFGNLPPSVSTFNKLSDMFEIQNIQLKNFGDYIVESRKSIDSKYKVVPRRVAGDKTLPDDPKSTNDLAITKNLRTISFGPGGNPNRKSEE